MVASTGGLTPRRSPVALALLNALLLAFPATLRAGEPPQFELSTAAGATHTGTLERLAADWSLRLAEDGESVAVAGRELISLRRCMAVLPPHPLGPQVVLANGDRVPLELGSLPYTAGERLHFHPAPPLRTAAPLDPPLETVALLWLAPPEGEADPALLLRRLLAAAGPRDLVLLRNGDRVEGTLTALDGKDGCRLTAGKRRVRVPLARVAAVAFSTEALVSLAPARPHAHAVLANGCRLALASARLDDKAETLSGKTLFGAAVEVPLDALAALDLRRGAAVHLSDLEPRRYVYTPFLGVAWPYVRDGSAAGRELRLGGDTYDKGLGMHAESRLTYELGGRYRRFEALVGLDARTGKRGRVRVEVLVDGKARDLGHAGELTAADGPLAVSIDVRGARELTLAVRFGRRGDVQAHVNWADARLVE